MRKVYNTLISALLVLITILTTACVVTDGSEQDDPNRTQLEVGIFDGGYGTAWLFEAKKRFEAIYPEVQIKIDADKKYSGTTLLNYMDGYKQDMFFGPITFYDFASQNKLLDISDIMDKPLSDIINGNKETKSINDKVWPDLNDFYSSYNNKTLAVPFGGAIYSINYDVDLFVSEELFISKNSTQDNIIWTKIDSEKSVGQDGIAGTYDDGLPVTFDDFKDLLDEMSRRGIMPFLWSDQKGYTANFLYSLAMSHEGKDNFNLMLNYDGEYLFEGDTEPTTITKENGYLLQKMDGKKKALEFIEYILDKNFYDKSSGTLSMDFKSAQSTYLTSRYDSNSKRIAFLIDGGHWYNEAKDTIKELEDMKGDVGRKFGIMPFPQFEGRKAEKTTYFASSFTQASLIKATAKQPDWAKKFLAFTLTDEILQLCTQMSGMVRPYKYEMQDSQLETMPAYYQSMWEAFSSEKNEVVYFNSKNPMIYQNERFFEDEWKWSCIDENGVALANPFIDLVNYKKNGLDAQSYYNSLTTYYNKTRWDAKFSKYYSGV